jgi:hypothetical protein
MAFADSTDLMRHIRVHTGEKPYVCPVDGCGGAWATPGNLSAHIRMVHDTEIVRLRKKEEEKVVKYFDEHAIEYTREHYISFDCDDVCGRSCRVDFVTMRSNIVFFTEVDEHQHKFYAVACDRDRPLQSTRISCRRSASKRAH